MKKMIKNDNKMVKKRYGKKTSAICPASQMAVLCGLVLGKVTRRWVLNRKLVIDCHGNARKLFS